MTMNIVLTAVGVALGLFVNIRYKKWLNSQKLRTKMRLGAKSPIAVRREKIRHLHIEPVVIIIERKENHHEYS